MHNLVLVTGGNGQVATALKGLKSDLDYMFFSRGELDISDYEAVAEKFDDCEPKLVINTAAYTSVDAAEDDLARADRINRLGPEVLARVCSKQKIPICQWQEWLELDLKGLETWVCPIK